MTVRSHAVKSTLRRKEMRIANVLIANYDLALKMSKFSELNSHLESAFDVYYIFRAHEIFYRYRRCAVRKGAIACGAALITICCRTVNRMKL